MVARRGIEMDLRTLTALNDFWQERFDQKNPRAAAKRKARDKKSGGIPKGMHRDRSGALRLGSGRRH